MDGRRAKPTYEDLPARPDAEASSARLGDGASPAAALPIRAVGLRASARAAERPITEPRRASRQIERRDATFRRALAIADVLAAGAALVLCVAVFGDDHLKPLALLALPLVVAAAKAHGLYDRDELLINKTTIDQAPQLFQCATLYALLVVGGQQYFVGGNLGLLQVLTLWGTLFLVAVTSRGIARRVAQSITPVERCLFVGTEDSFERLRSKLPDDDSRSRLVGRMSLTPAPDQEVVDMATSTLHRLIDDLAVDRVIIEPSDALPQTTLDFVREAKATSVRVSLLPRILEVVGSAIEVDDIDGLTLLGVRRFGLSRSSKALKRSFDAVGATLGLIALAPIIAVIAVLIKLDSRGPVIFRQPRVGRDGSVFEMWKFRTMVHGADELKAQLRARNDAAAGLFKISDDPRITRVGYWLRRASLDELAQLVNVLRGEMSLVGPRPLISDEDRMITGLDRRRLQLTPGMTGHWQILGSSRVPLAEMVKLDYLYVASWSLWSDVKILLRTVPYMIARRGI